HLIRAAASRTFCTAGSSRPIRMAMIAITTSNSISVNADRRIRDMNGPPSARETIDESINPTSDVAIVANALKSEHTTAERCGSQKVAANLGLPTLFDQGGVAEQSKSRECPHRRIIDDGNRVRRRFQELIEIFPLKTSTGRVGRSAFVVS